MPRRRRPIDDAANLQLEQAVRASRQTFVALSKALGCDRKTLYKWLDGTNTIPPEKLQRLCELIHLPQDQQVEQFRARGYLVPFAQPQPLHHLRAPVSDFVGREAEISRIVTALSVAAQQGIGATISGVRGMGGMGKTELALMAAQRLLPLFPDGQVLVELHGAGTAPLAPTHALQTILRALDPQARLPEDVKELQNRYLTQLHGKRFLILADDAQDAAQVRPLLPPTGCALLVTSRQRFVLPGMTSIDLSVLALTEAEQVLLAICPRIGDAAPQLAQLCAYLPLALRISASFLTSYDTYAVARYLDQLAAERMKYLRDPQEPDNPQASVEAALALSYTALDAVAQATLCQLSVFTSDFDHAAALAVLIHDADMSETALHQLRWRSLLEWDAERQRYRLHDLVQAFAADRLHEPRAVEWRYAEHFAGRVEDSAMFADNAPPRDWLEAIERELAHLRSALGWFVQHDLNERALGLAVALGPFWLARDAIREGSSWVETALAHTPDHQNDAQIQLQAQALLLLGELHRLQGDLPAAKGYLERSGALLLYRLEDEAAYADVAFNLGILAADQNEYQVAQDHFERSLAIFRTYNRLQRVGGALVNLGRITMNRGQFADAERLYVEAAATIRTTGDREQLGWLLVNLASLHSDQGDHETALRDITESLEQFEALGHRNGMAWASYLKGTILADHASYTQAAAVLEQSLMHFEHLAVAMGIAMTHNKLTSVALAQNDLHYAWKHAALSLHCYQEMQHQLGLGMSIEHIAMLVAERDPELSVALLGCAEAQLTGLRTHLAAIDHILIERSISMLHARLSEPLFTIRWVAGRALPLNQAVVLAQQVVHHP